jgi:hypothetical protein
LIDDAPSRLNNQKTAIVSETIAIRESSVMSSELGCAFHHFTSGWYYLIERGSDPGAFEPYGPFASFALAHAHLLREWGNPGTYTLPPDGDPVGEPEPDERWIVREAKLTVQAQAFAHRL